MALAEVQTTAWGLEFSVHECPKAIAQEIKGVFPKADPSQMLIVPTCQRASMDLVNTGEEVDKERDMLLEKFSAWAEKVCSALKEKGYWADYIDPCSGLPMIDREHNNTYNEVEGFAAILGYQTANAGCCKIILHPKWGSHVYPATLFVTAPLGELMAATEVVTQQ